MLIVASLLLAANTPGCARGVRRGALRTQSLGDDPVYLSSDLPTVVYTHDPDRGTSFLLSDVPVEDLLGGTVESGQVIHIELLWEPRAGKTPIASSATNVSIRHVVITSGEVGLYGGAGFAMPHGTPGDRRLRMSLYDATVRLLESTEGFLDPLSPARVSGSFNAVHDPLLARKIQRAASQLVTNAMGRSMVVSR
ncbi:MAG: hypothetical protein GY715_14010 [Planctomycetes bacterium]|nr:hypothetical protein [Planctomycetota bacterium]